MTTSPRPTPRPGPGATTPGPLLSVRDLSVAFDTTAGRIRVVEDVSFDIHRGERLAIVGESGSGKSVSALAVMGLLPAATAHVESGVIDFDGVDLLGLDRSRMRRYRGTRIAMIFQDAMTSLNPLLPIGRQIAEPLEEHLGLSRKQALARAVDLLDRVQIPGGEAALRKYPHEFSGGMRQRVMIATALGCEPDLLIADEPTTALDVTVQAEMLSLMRGLSDDLGVAVMIITHDLGVVAEFADRVSVMYAGRMVETARTAETFARPQHPYTADLLGSMPRVDTARGQRLRTIPGQIPSPRDRGAGCYYAPRCRFAEDRCRTDAPPLAEIAPGTVAACWRADELTLDGEGAAR